MFTRTLQAHMTCDLSVIVKNERVLNVTGSHRHVHFKTGTVVSKTVLDRNMVTTGH